MPKISRRRGHLFIYLFIRTLFSYNIVVSRACAATHKKPITAPRRFSRQIHRLRGVTINIKREIKRGPNILFYKLIHLSDTKKNFSELYSANNTK